jgi:hypothetical protein
MLFLRRTFLFVALLTFFGQLTIAQVEASSSAPGPQEIIRRSLSHWRRNLDAATNYTFQRRSVEQQLEKDGDAKRTEIRTYDVSIIYGEPYEKLIAYDDKPLSAEDQQKEEDKLNKFFEKQKNMSDADRAKGRAKERDKFQREIADELPLMLNYQLVGEEEFNGQPVWVLTATPKGDYHPNSRAGKLLSKLSGKVWITKADYQWVKAEADLSDDFTVGWFLFRLHKGSHMEFEQTRVNDELWLPKRIFIQGSGRITLKNKRYRNDTVYSNYRRFKSDVKITGVAEEHPETSTPQ